MIAGVDEVGRGPLAGPVITSAVILPDEYHLPGLTDSKKLSHKKRRILAHEIIEQAVCWSIGDASVNEIDELNILHATMLAMRRAVSRLTYEPSMVLVDGNRSPKFKCPSKAIVGGDGIEPCISAASIIAKVTRDELMVQIGSKYPDYGFEKHMGYPTKQHLEALKEFGVSPVHRRTFRPVKNILSEQSAD